MNGLIAFSFQKHFADNFELTKFPAKVVNLFKSFGEITAHTLSCVLRPNKFKVGLNQFTDWVSSSRLMNKS